MLEGFTALFAFVRPELVTGGWFALFWTKIIALVRPELVTGGWFGLV